MPTNCLNCAPDGTCQTCEPDFELDGNGGCEPECNLLNCASCNEAGECIQCVDDTFRVRDGMCTPVCNDQECRTCETSGDCIECEEPENFNIVDGACVRVCLDPNCAVCNQEDGVCTQCPSTMYLADADSSCQGNGNRFYTFLQYSSKLVAKKYCYKIMVWTLSIEGILSVYESSNMRHSNIP